MDADIERRKLEVENDFKRKAVVLKNKENQLKVAREQIDKDTRLGTALAVFFDMSIYFVAIISAMLLPIIADLIYELKKGKSSIFCKAWYWITQNYDVLDVEAEINLAFWFRVAIFCISIVWIFVSKAKIKKMLKGKKFKPILSKTITIPEFLLPSDNIT